MNISFRELSFFRRGGGGIKGWSLLFKVPKGVGEGYYYFVLEGVEGGLGNISIL
jgi:hypothetical protein